MITISNILPVLFGNRRGKVFDLSLGAYQRGGEEITASDVGLEYLERLIIEPPGGYSMSWGDGVVKLYEYAPPIVYEEAHTIASNQITLSYPPAAILNIASGTATQLLVEPSATLAANMVKLSAPMAEGELSTLTFHADTSGAVKVTYITQAWKEVWDNRKASQTIATADHVADLGEVACFIESCTAAGTVPSLRPRYLVAGDTAATLEAEVDFTDAGAADKTTLTFLDTDAITGVTISYIALPASGFLKNNFVEAEAVAISSQAGATAYPVLFNSLCGQIPDNHAAGARTPHYLMMPEGDALGTGAECAIDWHKLKTVAGHQIRVNDATTDRVSVTYVKGFPFEIQTVPLEVRSGAAINTTTRAIALGY